MTPHVCRVCRTVLDWVVPFDGSAGFWKHSAISQPTDGHEAVPVPQMETLIVHGRCDFCGQTDPQWSYLVATTIVLDAGPFGAVGDGDNRWAACDGCAELVDVRAVRSLVARVRQHWPAEMRRNADVAVLLFEHYSALLQGPVIKEPLKKEL